MRGMGRIFQRKGSSFWWISFYRRGKEIRESSRSANRKEAEKLLRHRIREIGAESLGLKPFVGHSADRIMMDSIFKNLVSDYSIRGVNSLDFIYHLKPIREYFGDMRAVDVTEVVIDRFIRECQDAGKSDATINRETQLLGQTFRLAVERKTLAMAPKVRRIPNADKPREGFFERPEFEAVVKHLPADIQDFTRFAYLTGWRKGEIASLRWEDVDLLGGIIRLRGENSKNKKPRKVALEGELLKLIQRRASSREIITESGVRSIALVFHRDGLPVRSFRKAWTSACKGAKVPGKLFHDLRRTAIRNMVRAGVSESIAMRISGHKTASVFRRYDITTETDLREAARKTEVYIKNLPKELKTRTEHGQS